MAWLIRVSVALSLLLSPSFSPSLPSSSSLSFVQCQYGFGVIDDSWYRDRQNINTPDPYDDITNATAADEDLKVFRSFVTVEEPTVLYLRQHLFSVGNAFASTSYRRFTVNGRGSWWTMMSGVETVVVDLRPFHPNYTNSSTAEQMRRKGAVLNANGTISYNITFANQHDGVDIMHNHGQLGAWWSDGVPYLTANPINSGEEQTYTYTIDPTTNSGTYFLHSHYGFNNLQGMSVPLIIQYPVDSGYPLAEQLNNPNITDVLLFLEDFCLVFTNADDFNQIGPGKEKVQSYSTITDTYICENPQLAFRALYGEWNSHKGPMMVSPDHITLDECSKPTTAPEFAMAHIFANERTYDEARRVLVKPGALVRLRIINGARMTNFLVELPPALNDTVVVAVDGHYVKPVLLTSFGSGGNATVWVGVAQRVDLFVTMPKDPSFYSIFAYTEAPRPGECGEGECQKYEHSLTSGIILDTATKTRSDDDAASPNSLSQVQPPQPFPSEVPGVGMLATHPEFLLNQNLALVPWSTEQHSLEWTSHFREHATRLETIRLTGYNGIFGLNGQPHYQFPPSIPLTIPHLFQPYEAKGKHPPPTLNITFGDRVCITFVNHNWETHPMHLHGHAFQLVAVNDVEFRGPIRDTVLVPAGNCNRVTICFNANSTGGGTHGLHCHMAVHEMAGMFTMIEYKDYAPIETVLPKITSLAQASAVIVASANTLELVSFKVTTSVFVVFFAIACVVIAFLTYKLRQHLYQPAATGIEMTQDSIEHDSS